MKLVRSVQVLSGSSRIRRFTDVPVKISTPVETLAVMPKVPSHPQFPMNGLFPIAKPVGPTCMRVIDLIQPLLLDSKLFEDPANPRLPSIKGDGPGRRASKKAGTSLKIGQGGTLDPLADGVLVIGVGKGTKQLQKFLDCSKEYISIGLFGASTTTYDADGPVLHTGPYEHLTKDDVEKVLDKFRGEITQVPPIFSALKMDGKPLYEYARENKPLPRPIPTRRSKVEIELLEFTPASRTPGDGGHEYKWPTGVLSDEQKSAFKQLNELALNAPKAAPQPINRVQLSKKALKALRASGQAEAEPVVEEQPTSAEIEEALKMELPDLDREPVPEVMPSGARPPIVKFKMTVSSGTYVRSIIHDIGLALGSAAHVVTLTRTRQKQFALYGDEVALEASSTATTAPTADASQSKPEVSSAAVLPGGSVPWAVWERAIEEHTAMVEAEQAAYAEAVKGGITEEEIDMEFSPKALWDKRRAADLKEWEVEVMKRFVDVDA